MLGLDGGKLEEEAKVVEVNFNVNSDEVFKLGEVFEDKSSLLYDKADVVGAGELNFDEKGKLVFNLFTPSDNCELDKNIKEIEKEQFFSEDASMVGEDSHQELKEVHTVKEKRSEKQRNLVNCNVCDQTVRDGWNLTRHMRSMHSARGEISCPKDFCDSTFESEYDMKVKTTQILTL